MVEDRADKSIDDCLYTLKHDLMNIVSGMYLVSIYNQVQGHVAL